MAATDTVPQLIRRLLGRDKTPRATAGDEFLPDAIEMDNRRPPLVARGVLYAVAVFIVTIIVWAKFSQVDQVVSAEGRLITTAQTVVIQPLETSVIRSIDVRVGQLVRKGETIATLDPTFAESDVSQIRQRIRSLAAEVERLEAEANERVFKPASRDEDSQLQYEMFEKRRSEYRARASGFDAERARLNADLAGTLRSHEVLQQRLDSLKQIEAMKSDLKDRQYVSQMHLLESREKRLEAQQMVEDAKSKAQQLREQIVQNQHAHEAFNKAWRQKVFEDLVRARRDRDSLMEQLNKAERRSALVSLKAPMDATVLEISKRSVGSVAKEAEPIVTLVPQGVPIEAEIQIPADEIGFVRKNDPVRIKIDAFPFQRHGTVEGQLSVIGEDSFLADQNAANRSRLVTKAYYPGRVTLTATALKGVPADTRLSPGMTLMAEIKVNQRSVLSYFLYPLTKAFDESIREP